MAGFHHHCAGNPSYSVPFLQYLPETQHGRHRRSDLEADSCGLRPPCQFQLTPAPVETMPVAGGSLRMMRAAATTCPFG
eukprot:CAMPEP_0172739258 /NCGR_PEP_ID=MMETSP1074-20121228/122179_1 /TAXON_ID=2916 /ORGANISM="Ceratium fusus, Strain PA161109" /LENGTH=78 /DNA_ID=CAMNT_0013569091 /DNA_START=67 /DNA_END=300 /DNA_ORIENTATION=-